MDDPYSSNGDSSSDYSTETDASDASGKILNIQKIRLFRNMLEVIYKDYFSDINNTILKKF